MKLIKNLFGAKKKIFSKNEPNTLAEINESPDLRLATAKELEKIAVASTGAQVKKIPRSSSKATTAKPQGAAAKNAAVKKSPAKNSQESDKALPADKAKSPAKNTANKATKQAVSVKKSTSQKEADNDKTVQKKASAPKEKSTVAAKNTTTKNEAKSKKDTQKNDVKPEAKPVKSDATKKATATPKKNNEEITETKSTRSGKFEIKKSKDGRFVFNLYASNNVIVATSQIYSSSTAAMNGIKSVIANAASANLEDQTLKTVATVPYPKWEIYRDKSEQYRFRLCASNGSCVCHSQGYTSKTNCKKGIESIIKFAADAGITKAYINKDN